MAENIVENMGIAACYGIKPVQAKQDDNQENQEEVSQDSPDLRHDDQAAAAHEQQQL